MFALPVGIDSKQDPKRLVLVSGSEDTTVRVWSLTEQCCTAVLKAHLSYVTSLAFLPGGAGLISGGRDRVLNVWGLDRCVCLHGVMWLCRGKSRVAACCAWCRVDRTVGARCHFMWHHDHRL